MRHQQLLHSCQPISGSYRAGAALHRSTCSFTGLGKGSPLRSDRQSALPRLSDSIYMPAGMTNRSSWCPLPRRRLSASSQLPETTCLNSSASHRLHACGDFASAPAAVPATSCRRLASPQLPNITCRPAGIRSSSFLSHQPSINHACRHVATSSVSASAKDSGQSAGRDSAWMDRDIRIESSNPSGPLAGRTFIAKDLYDVSTSIT